jgi:hypothetical protein
MLEEIDVQEFLDLLDYALDIVQDEMTKTESTVLDAIITRISFCKAFLQVVSQIQISPKKRRDALETCQTLLSKITETMDLGKPSVGAFSPRIQKRLSICVPPRPMVSIDPKDAAMSMKTILEDLSQIDTIQDYAAPHELLV